MEYIELLLTICNGTCFISYASLACYFLIDANLLGAEFSNEFDSEAFRLPMLIPITGVGGASIRITNR